MAVPTRSSSHQHPEIAAKPEPQGSTQSPQPSSSKACYPKPAQKAVVLPPSSSQTRSLDPKRDKRPVDPPAATPSPKVKPTVRAKTTRPAPAFISASPSSPSPTPSPDHATFSKLTRPGSKPPSTNNPHLRIQPPATADAEKTEEDERQNRDPESPSGLGSEPESPGKAELENEDTLLPLQITPPRSRGRVFHTTSVGFVGDEPEPEDLKTLRRVPGKIPFRVFAIGFVELAERMSYYGTVAVFVNFLQQPNPGTTTGRPPDPSDPNALPGALGLGQEKASAITTLNQFWIYLVPLMGAYLADTYFGRFKVIGIALFVSIIGHTILTASAIPFIMHYPPHALGLFLAGLVVMGLGTGCFKPNISPLIAEQVEGQNMWINQLENGERVIVDPALTVSKVYHWFYMFINAGSLIGQVGMAYTERYIGYWAAFMLPTVCFSLAIPILAATRRMYSPTVPRGSVLGKAMKLLIRGTHGRWHLSPIKSYKHLNDGTFWHNLKPSQVPVDKRPHWYIFDDAWVDEVSRGFSACTVFLWYPLYWLAYNQISNNLTSQAATMALHGIPNDIISNLDPVCTILLIPVLTSVVYPALSKRGFRFTPIKRIATGFLLASMSMVWACLVQVLIYRFSPCGKHASTCHRHAPITIWAQTGSYILLSISEIFAAITALEYAFNKAPRNMRSLVTAFALFTSAISAAIGEAFVPLESDPLLVWNYGAMAIFSAIAAACFWATFRDLDRREDELNRLPPGHMGDDPYPRMPSRTDIRLF